MSDRSFTFFHAPNTRSTCILRLIVEMGVPYDLHLLSLERRDHKAPAYLAVNPLGKVPAIRHGDTVVTEQGAIALYLGDLFPETGLCPQMGDPLRGALLRWLFFYGDCIEPAVLQKAMKWPDPQASMAGYGSYDDVIAALTAQLAVGPWFLGERFTVADGLWGSALTWLTQFGLVPSTPEIGSYVARFATRPAAAEVAALEAGFIERLKSAG